METSQAALEGIKTYTDSLLRKRRLTNNCETRIMCRELYSFMLGQQQPRSVTLFGNYYTFEQCSFQFRANVVLYLAKGLRRDSLKKMTRKNAPKNYKYNQGRYSMLKSLLSGWMTQESKTDESKQAMNEFLAIERGERDDAL